MRLLVTLVFTTLLIGCSTFQRVPHQTRYQRTTGSKADLFVELDGEWVKFAEDVGDYRLCQSPDGRYVVLTDCRGCYQVSIKAYDTHSRRLLDITQEIRKRIPSLSDKPLFIGYRFTNNTTLECGIDFVPGTAEEKPVAQALKSTRFFVDISDFVEGMLSQ